MKKNIVIVILSVLIIIFCFCIGSGIFCECKECDDSLKTNVGRKDTIDNVSTDNVMLAKLDTIACVVCRDTCIGNNSFHLYYPQNYMKVELYCGTEIPDGIGGKQLCCFAAAYTGKGYQNGFSHSLIAGNHVFNGKLYSGYPCNRNTGAFVFYNGNYSFLYNHYGHELLMAAAHQGMGFAQEMIIHNGLIMLTIRNDESSNRFRALCELNKELCIIESCGILSFGEFKNALVSLCVKEALYLDMGGWSYSWYKNSDGEIVRPFPENKNVLTNAIVFE